MGMSSCGFSPVFSWHAYLIIVSTLAVKNRILYGKRKLNTSVDPCLFVIRRFFLCRYLNMQSHANSIVPDQTVLMSSLIRVLLFAHILLFE